MTHEFWKSERAVGYPDFITMPDGTYRPLKDGLLERRIIGEMLAREHLVRETGEMLDIGAASCSGLIFGSQNAATRVTAVDISPHLLANNPVPVERKLVMDVGHDRFPVAWGGKFQDAFAILMHRYVTEHESLHLAEEVLKILRPGGRFIIVELSSLLSADLAQTMGELRIFDPDTDADILEEAGFSSVRTDELEQYWFESGRNPIRLDLVVGFV